VDIRLYRIIYECVEEIQRALEGLLSPELKEEILGHAEVRQVFQISRIGTVAGCYVTDGTIARNARVRILRDGLPIHTGTITSLKRFKEDVREVSAGYECGLMVSGFEDFRVGDVVEAFRLVEHKRTLS
jgi:translation initiation factor IF-2